MLLQNGRCYWCDRPMLPLDSPSVWRASADHVIPLRAGGTTEWRNIVAAHWWCNHRRTQPPSQPPKETAMPEERPGATIADEIARLVRRNPLPSEEETRLRREAALLNAQTTVLRAKEDKREAERRARWGWLGPWLPPLLGIVFGVGVAVVVLLWTWPWVCK